MRKRVRNKLFKFYRQGSSYFNTPVNIGWEDRQTNRRGIYRCALRVNSEDPDDDPLYWWLVGNGACDHNRSSFVRHSVEDHCFSLRVGNVRYPRFAILFFQILDPRSYRSVRRINIPLAEQTS